MRRIIALSLIVLGLAVPAQAQILFQMDTSSGAAPLAGFDTTEGDAEVGVVVDRTRVAGAGPDGQDVYRFDFLHDASQLNVGSAYGGEFYLGWFKDVGAPPTAGDSRFARFRFKVSTATTFEAINSSTGASSQIIHKLLILGDGATGRTIVSVHGDVASGTFELQVGRDGGGNLKFPGLLRNTWYDVQVETVTGGSGSITAWINNDTYASPDGTVTGLAMGAALYDWFAFGYYNNRMLAASPAVYSIDLTDAVYATTFDSAWAAGGGGGSTVPGAPTIGTATSGNAQATVTFSAPASDGGSAVTGYTVTSSPGGFTGAGAASPITVTGLANGTPYTFTVTATNAIGVSSASAASNSVTPTPPPASVGGRKLRVVGSWCLFREVLQ